MNFRYIDSGKNNAFYNMAVDEALLLEQDDCPVLRFYEFQKAISLGIFQKRLNEVNGSACLQNHIDVVRRPTGGGLVFHGDNVEFTYSLIFPEAMLGKEILESYKKVHQILILAFKQCHILGTHAVDKTDGQVPDLCFIKPTKYDVLVNSKKIAGAAQRRKNKRILHQGYIFFDCSKMPSFYDALALRNREIYLSRDEQSISFSQLSHASRDILKKYIIENTARVFNTQVEASSLTDKEEKLAKRLYEDKYGTEEWNFKR